MARLCHHFLLLLLPFLLACKTISSAGTHHHQQLKSLHFTFYQQETANKTTYLIVNGVASVNRSETTAPFGSIFAFRDPLTTTADPSSRVAGFAEGLVITSSFDGLRTVVASKVTLSIKHHDGTISLLGGPHNTRPANVPVIGGTSDFLFVQGYARVSPVDLVGLHVIYKIEFHLYWPPFASLVAPLA